MPNLSTVKLRFRCSAETLDTPDAVHVVVSYNTMTSDGKKVTSHYYTKTAGSEEVKQYDGGANKINTLTFILKHGDDVTSSLYIPNGEYVYGNLQIQIYARPSINDSLLLRLTTTVDPTQNNGNIYLSINGSLLSGGTFSLVPFNPPTVKTMVVNPSSLYVNLDGSKHSIVCDVTSTDGSLLDMYYSFDPGYFSIVNAWNSGNSLHVDFIPVKTGSASITFTSCGRTVACKVNIGFSSSNVIILDCFGKYEPWDKSVPFSKNGKAKYIGAEKIATDKYRLYFSDVVDYIPAGAFTNNDSIREVTLPTDCLEVGPCAFGWCANLQTVNFNSKLQRIEACAFHSIPGDDKHSQKGVKNFTLPGSLRYIGSCAFRDVRCSRLDIPAGVTLAENAFLDTGALKDVYLHDKTPNTTAPVVFSPKKVHVPKASLQAYINSKAFMNCTLVGDL